MSNDAPHGQKGPERTALTTDGGREIEYTDLSDFQRDLLFVVRALELRDAAPTTDAILDAFEETYAGSFRHGRLYPALHELEALGFLDEHEDDEPTYELTGNGRALLVSHLEQVAELLAIPLDDETLRAERDGAREDDG